MKRNLSLSLCLLCFLTSVHAQYKRRVLLEEFTQAGCPPCAQQNPAFNARITANEAYVTPIMYHASFPGTDPMHTQTALDVLPRQQYYSVWGTPFLYVNGNQIGISSLTNSRIQYDYNNETPVNMTVTHRLNATFDSVLIEVSVASTKALEGDFRLHVAITEAQIQFAAPPGSNGEKDFPHVLRKLLPDHNGFPLGNMEAGFSKTYQFQWAVKNFYDLNQLSVAAWVQHQKTKEVWQSARSLPNTSIAGGNFAAITLDYNQEFVFNCKQTFKPTFSLTNLGTTDLTSATIRYGVEGGSQYQYVWNGNLYPTGKTSVQLPEITFASTGYHPIQLAVVETNLGRTLNLVDSKAVILLNSFYQSFSPLEASQDFESEIFPPVNWGLYNFRLPKGQGWALGAGVGVHGSKQSAFRNFYDAPIGSNPALILPKLNLNTANTWSLSFYHAYAPYKKTSGISNDRLIISASTSCSNTSTGTTLYEKGGATLQTAPATTVRFVPLDTQWVHNEVDLSTYQGKTDVFLRFLGYSDSGNDLYVDDIRIIPNISPVYIVNPIVQDLTIYPNPVSTSLLVSFNLSQSEAVQIQVYNALGNLVLHQPMRTMAAGDHKIPINFGELPAGQYALTLQSPRGVAAKKFVTKL